MKTMKKRTAAAVAMVVGVTVLAGAAFANYSTSNGYEVGKTAFKGLLDNENYTANVTFSYDVDGENIAKAETTEMYDRASKTMSRKEISSDYYSSGEQQYNTWANENERIIYTKSADGTEYSEGYTSYGFYGNFDMMGTADENEKETNQKIVRFVELLGDTLVGDLKNNVVMTASDDNSTTYEINLDAIQIPELVNAGLSAMFSSVGTYDSGDPMMKLGTEPVAKSASLKFTVDNEGRLIDGVATGVMAGEGHEATVSMSLSMSDYGSTVPETVDPSTLPNYERYEPAEETVEIETE